LKNAYPCLPKAPTSIDVRAVWRACNNRYGKNGDWLYGDFGMVDAMCAPIALSFLGYQATLDNFEKDYV